MLAAIQRDHLTGHRRRRQQETQCGGDLIRAGAAPQWHLAAALEALLTRQPIGPSAAAARGKSSVTAPSSERSAINATALPPPRAILAASASASLREW